jgi:hypothetical protein
MRCHNSSMSPASSVNSPAVSSDGANGRQPSSGSRPNVGLNPTTPQNDAGRSTDPCVCVPRAKGAIAAATAAADPLELPPGVCRRLRGLRVGAGSK